MGRHRACAWQRCRLLLLPPADLPSWPALLGNRPPHCCSAPLDSPSPAPLCSALARAAPCAVLPPPSACPISACRRLAACGAACRCAAAPARAAAPRCLPACRRLSQALPRTRPPACASPTQSAAACRSPSAGGSARAASTASRRWGSSIRQAAAPSEAAASLGAHACSMLPVAGPCLPGNALCAGLRCWPRCRYLHSSCRTAAPCTHTLWLPPLPCPLLPRCRCNQPGTEFKSVGMFRPPREHELQRQQSAVAGRDQLAARGAEQKWANSW